MKFVKILSPEVPLKATPPYKAPEDEVTYALVFKMSSFELLKLLFKGCITVSVKGRRLPFVKAEVGERASN